MASRCSSRIINRASISSFKSSIKSNVKPSINTSSNFTSSPLRRFSFSRFPCELGGVQSMLPLHSAVATARMTSCLSVASTSCRALSQGTLCCTSPGL